MEHANQCANTAKALLANARRGRYLLSICAQPHKGHCKQHSGHHRVRRLFNIECIIDAHRSSNATAIRCKLNTHHRFDGKHRMLSGHMNINQIDAKQKLFCCLFFSLSLSVISHLIIDWKFTCTKRDDLRPFNGNYALMLSPAARRQHKHQRLHRRVGQRWKTRTAPTPPSSSTDAVHVY